RILPCAKTAVPYMPPVIPGSEHVGLPITVEVSEPEASHPDVGRIPEVLPGTDTARADVPLATPGSEHVGLPITVEVGETKAGDPRIGRIPEVLPGTEATVSHVPASLVVGRSENDRCILKYRIGSRVRKR